MRANAGTTWAIMGMTIGVLCYLLPGAALAIAGYSVIPLSFGVAVVGLWWARTGLPPRKHLTSFESVIQLLVIVYLLWIFVGGLVGPYHVENGTWAPGETHVRGYLIIGVIAGLFAVVAALIGHGKSAPVSQQVRCAFWAATAVVHWQVVNRLGYLVDTSDQAIVPSVILPIPAVALALLTGPWAGEGWSRKPRAAVADEAAPEA